MTFLLILSAVFVVFFVAIAMAAAITAGRESREEESVELFSALDGDLTAFVKTLNRKEAA